MVVGNFDRGLVEHACRNFEKNVGNETKNAIYGEGMGEMRVAKTKVMSLENLGKMLKY